MPTFIISFDQITELISFDILTGNPALVAAFAGTSYAAGIGSGALPQTADRPDDRNNIAPRIGFAWNVFGKDKTILRGGFGMYYGRIINSNILQTYMDSGATNAQISLMALSCIPALASSLRI